MCNKHAGFFLFLVWEITESSFCHSQNQEAEVRHRGGQAAQRAYGQSAGETSQIKHLFASLLLY